jgi:very-short-patch-repair endonuclease
MGALDRTVQEKVARLAARQHGVVTRAQLLGAGVSRREIESRVRAGVLLRAHRGVYRVGHRAPSVEAAYLAAVLAAGDRARLAGGAAAYLWKLVRGMPPQPEVLTRTERRIDGVRTRRSRELHPAEVTSFNAIPVTTVARTLVDLAAEQNEDELARACHEAGVRYRTTPADVRAVLNRRPNAPGATKVRRVMEGDVKVSLSGLEARFLTLLRAEDLRLPETNRPAGGRRVDCRWPMHRLTVELDGYRFHNSRYSWEQDRKREREARARGDDFRRYTYADVFEDPASMLQELRAALTRDGPPPPPRRQSETASGEANRGAPVE